MAKIPKKKTDVNAKPKARRNLLPLTEKIDHHSDILEDVMWRVFGLKPGDYTLSDESYPSEQGREWPSVIRSVKRLYGIHLDREREPYLWEMLAEVRAAAWKPTGSAAKKRKSQTTAPEARGERLSR